MAYSSLYYRWHYSDFLYEKHMDTVVKDQSKRIVLLCKLAATASIIFFIVAVVFHARAIAIESPTFHLDGAFQTASALFRIDATQLPGRDFFPYLGIGPLLFIYPFFKLAGANLAASVFAAHCVTLLFGWFCLSVLFHLIFRPKAARYTWAASAFIFVAPYVVARYTLLSDLFEFAFWPGNSLRPVRAAIPYIIGLAAFGLIEYCQILILKKIFAGLLISFAMLWSNDFALVTAVFFWVFFAVHFYLKEKSLTQSVVVFAAITIFLWLFLLFLITAGHPLAMLKYNYVSVAQDQWWYFSPYDPDLRVFDLADVSKLASARNAYAMGMLVLVSLAAIVSRKIEFALLMCIGLILAAGGCVATLGGHVEKDNAYFAGFHFWAAALSVLAVIRVSQLFLTQHLKLSLARLFMIESRWLSYVFFLFLFSAAYKIYDYVTLLSAVKNDTEKFYVEELGGYMGSEWRDYVQLARTNRNKSVVEEYWGVWSAINKKISLWPVDSVIHALGSVREEAGSKLSGADIIISTRYATSTRWQPWILSQNFWFYDELFLQWEPTVVSPTTVVWKKRENARDVVEMPCEILSDQRSVVLHSTEKGFYKLEVNYRVSKQKFDRFLLMLENKMSFGTDAGGFVSIPTNKTSFTLPVYKASQSAERYESKVVGSETAAMHLLSCMASKISFENDEVLHVFN